MNLAYRWFIGYPLNEAVPHFATVSYNFKHRFNTASVEYLAGTPDRGTGKPDSARVR